MDMSGMAARGLQGYYRYIQSRAGVTPLTPGTGGGGPGREREEHVGVRRRVVTVDDLWCITVPSSSSPAQLATKDQRAADTALGLGLCLPRTLIIIHYLLIRDFTHLVCLIYGSTASTSL